MSNYPQNRYAVEHVSLPVQDDWVVVDRNDFGAEVCSTKEASDPAEAARLICNALNAWDEAGMCP